MVVLPEPVPPEMMTFIRQAPAIFRQVAIFSDIEPKPRIMSSVIGFSENLRMEMAVPRSDSGGIMTLTRLPSEAGVGDVVWSAAADLVDDALGDLEQMLLVAELDLGQLQLALALDEGLVGAVDHDIADRGVGQQLLERPEAQQFVDQHLFQRELLAAVEVIFSSASTSPMIGRNSSASSSLLRVAAASGSTRSSRRGRTCSLMRWTEASKPSDLLLARSPLAFWRSLRRSIAPVGPTGADGALPGRGHPRTLPEDRRPVETARRRPEPAHLHRARHAELWTLSSTKTVTLAECVHN